MRLILLFLSLTFYSNYFAINNEQPEDSLLSLKQELNKQITLAEYFIEIDSAKARAEIDKIDFSEMDFQDSVDFKIANKKIDFYKNHYSPNEVLVELDILKEIASRKDDSLFYAFTENRMIEVYLDQSKFKEAIQRINQILPIYENRRMNSEVGELLLKKGAALYSLSEYVKSIEIVFKAAEKFKKLDSKRHLAFSYLQIGTTYIYIEEYEKAVKNYKLAKIEFFSLGDTLGAAVCDLNIGLSFLETEQYDSAIAIYNKVKPIITKSHRKIIVGRMYHNIGNSFLGAEQHDSAKYYYQKALNNDLKISYKIGVSSNYAMMASLFNKTLNTDSAIYYGEKSLELIKNYKDYDIEAIVTKVLGECYREKGNYKESTRFYEWNIRVNDSIQKENQLLDKIATDQDQRIDDYREELFLAKQREERIEQENQNQQQLIIGMTIFALLMIGLLVLFSITNRRNRSLNRKLIGNQAVIEDDLRVKKSLLNEIHHRVKNNLQVISSMLSIQNQYITDPKLNLIIEECKSRIGSMALIHESLYKRDTNDITSFNTYIKNLIPRLVQTYQVDENRIRLKMDVDAIQLSIDESVPCGLLINEIISNALKHAFPKDQNGEISIKMYQEDNTVRLLIADNGIGLPNNISPDDQDTFGFLLIYTLASQLDAEMKISKEGGLTFDFSWKMKDYQMLS